MYARYFKRSVDVLLALPTVFLLAPVFMIVASLIICVDGPPVIFTQKRVGRHGKLFTFYKFRSMPIGTGDFASDQIGEFQLSWVGKFIRRTNLDEIPQLFNVLRGDMSIVGPRPAIPQQLELIDRRLENGSIACRPGLTGLAQISAYDRMPVLDKARFDGEYAKKVTLFGDLKIILKTFAYLLKPPPVY